MPAGIVCNTYGVKVMIFNQSKWVYVSICVDDEHYYYSDNINEEW